MSLSYAGVSLPVVTPEILAKIESRLGLSSLYPWDRTLSEVGRGGFGLVAKAWAERPIRLGTLSWPTNASRWATAFFLVDDGSLASISEKVYGPYQAADLEIGDGTQTITASMYMLTPRPLLTNGEGQGLYLLSLVDQRYFWTQARVTSLSVQAGATWSSLFSELVASLPSPAPSLPTVTAASAYGTTPALDLYEENVPALLDWAALAIGQKFVVALDGSCAVTPYSSANSQLNTNLEQPLNVYGGGELLVDPSTTNDLPPLLPESVSIDFLVSGTGLPAPGFQTSAVAFSSLGILTGAETNSSTYDYFSPAILAEVSGSTWTNQAACAALANQWATDFYNFQTSSPEYVFAGIANWTPSGLEDRIEWTYTRNMVSTRVCRLPYNSVSVRDDLPIQEQSQGFWARITGQATTTPLNVYSFEQVDDPSPPNGWVVTSGGITGTLNAEEVTASATVEINTIVRLIPNSEKVGWYLFEYAGDANHSQIGLVNTQTQQFGGTKFFDSVGIGYGTPVSLTDALQVSGNVQATGSITSLGGGVTAGSAELASNELLLTNSPANLTAQITTQPPLSNLVPDSTYLTLNFANGNAQLGIGSGSSFYFNGGQSTWTDPDIYVAGTQAKTGSDVCGNTFIAGLLVSFGNSLVVSSLNGMGGSVTLNGSGSIEITKSGSTLTLALTAAAQAALNEYAATHNI